MSLRDSEVTDFYHFLKNKFEFDDINKRKIGSSTIGRQADKDTWILSSTLYINGDGVIVSKDSSKYVWLSHIALQNAGNTSDINCASLSPRVSLPLSTDNLSPLLLQLKKCFKHNFVPSVMALASSVMSLHYETILDNYEGCPVPYLYGVSQTGKTQACKTALALVGMQKKGFYKKNTSQKWFLDRCSLSSMPFVIDDPRDLKDRKGNTTVPAELLDLANDIFDGGIVANLRTGAIWPRSTCIITANALPSSDKYDFT